MAFLGLGRQAKAGHPYDSQVTSRRERVDGIDSAGHGEKPLGNCRQCLRPGRRVEASPHGEPLAQAQPG